MGIADCNSLIRPAGGNIFPQWVCLAVLPVNRDILPPMTPKVYASTCSNRQSPTDPGVFLLYEDSPDCVMCFHSGLDTVDLHLYYREAGRATPEEITANTYMSFDSGYLSQMSLPLMSNTSEHQGEYRCSAVTAGVTVSSSLTRVTHPLLVNAIGSEWDYSVMCFIRLCNN